MCPVLRVPLVWSGLICTNEFELSDWHGIGDNSGLPHDHAFLFEMIDSFGMLPDNSVDGPFGQVP